MLLGVLVHGYPSVLVVMKPVSERVINKEYAFGVTLSAGSNRVLNTALHFPVFHTATRLP